MRNNSRKIKHMTRNKELKNKNKNKKYNKDERNFIISTKY